MSTEASTGPPMWERVKFAIRLIEEAYDEQPFWVLLVLCGSIFLASLAGYLMLRSVLFS